MKLLYRVLQSEEAINRIAQIHNEVFPNYSLTSLGEKLLRRFYFLHAQSENSHLYGAFQGQEMVGFVLFSCETEQLKRKFILQNFVSISCRRLKAKTLLNLNFVRFIYNNIIFRVTKRGVPVTSNSERKQPHIRLLSIGTLPVARGTACTRQLVDYALSDLKKKNYQSTGLSVYPSNKRAITFYEKMNFQQEKSERGLLFYYRTL